jgi:hypothetical protein
MEENVNECCLCPRPDLAGATLIARLDLPTRVLEAHGLTTVQAVRGAPDKSLLSLPGLGPRFGETPDRSSWTAVTD